MMQFAQKSIRGLFDSSEKTMVIPVYQRAYSWEIKQIKVFLEDLQQQIGGNVYSYGNLLLETIKKDVAYEIIDGQQRLTTLVIFMRSLLNVLKGRADTDKEINFKKKEKIYFKDDGIIKLCPVDYDRGYFNTLIIENKDNCTISTPSQKRMKAARDYFAKALSELPTNELLRIFQTAEEAQVNCIELAGKKEAALMFELQNNRGKELSNLEKLKSFFMYQLYVISPERETNANITYISDKFEPIYRIINDLQGSGASQELKDLNENSIFTYHCYAYTAKGFGYRTLDDLTDEYKKLTGDKVQWIKEFADELAQTFANMKHLQGCKNIYLSKLNRLGIPYFVYPFLIKGMKYFGDDVGKMDRLFKTMEILSFRYKLISSRSDLASKLSPALRTFSGDAEALTRVISKTLHNNWYWSEDRAAEFLNGNMYKNPMVNYVLWEYEHSLQMKGYDTNELKIAKEQIEHISPVTANAEGISAGYEVGKDGQYNEDFVKDWLHSLGNLLIIAGSHNASIGNRPFAAKLKTYVGSPLLQQKEIPDFLDPKRKRPKWDSWAISRRQDKILAFAKERWRFDVMPRPRIIRKPHLIKIDT